MISKVNIVNNLKSDFSSGLVVFLIALPLCLGIALASGAPLFAGLISGIVGGIVIGSLSKSALSVSGPAAGLTAIVLSAITEIGVFEIFLCAVIVAGLIQIILGLLKAGSISYYFPSNVIEGMLAAIGIIIILNQLEHIIGIAGIESEEEEFKIITFINALKNQLHHNGALIIGGVSILILLLWQQPFMKKLNIIPGALVVVAGGILLNEFFIQQQSSLAVTDKNMLVNIPVITNATDFFNSFTLPNFSGFLRADVWMVGITIAVVASIETLLCIEAIDKLDPHKRNTPTNRELLAQGTGNMLSGFIGGLPITSVIVRSSANLGAGAKSKQSAIIHGIFLLLSCITIPFLLNKIPLATLAAVLIMTGYKLCKPAVFKHMWQQGKWQFIPFTITVIAVVATDLLKGVAIGMMVSIAYLLRQNIKNAYYFHRTSYKNGDVVKIELSEEVSFLNKASILLTLDHLPENSMVIIDAQKSKFIDHDVLQVIREFKDIKAKDKNIKVAVNGFKDVYNIENTEYVSMISADFIDISDNPQRTSGTQRTLLHDLIVSNKKNKTTIID
ncbi:MAG TPA: SulP family inorganic anion transporter [Chitinophagales bacterium]|nr:SulP family inorganic anion transporter [Chitinophagales bacterium]HMW12214.1 SulP family inorganic anion transporter [Chitinophagales bacterium]HMX60327.1 SulP family inorganic anion transporter [Chitinophagales bacterium]HMY23898.1 SulP family inorganic anion transporter [Chitinophagales bacterium]HMZ33205.1 SulP family inorganic anion transporter [Chitinophagales bacterium]